MDFEFKLLGSGGLAAVSGDALLVVVGGKEVPRALDKRIDLVISLCEWTPEVVEERTGLEENFYEILGIKVPHIEFYVRPGRDIAIDRT